jgi:hypothetical protein
MMPSIDPRKEAAKELALTAAFIGGAAAVASALLSATPFIGWQWVIWVLGLTAIILCAVIAKVTGGGRPRGRGSGGGSGARGGDDAGPAGAAEHRRPMLVAASRMMPRSAGSRWLAEAESVLSETAAARRGAAIRSYLRSAPGLLAMMWAREILRRARLGPRRLG